MPSKTYNETRSRLDVQTGLDTKNLTEGKPTPIIESMVLEESDAQKELEKATKEGQAAVIQFTQTFLFHTVSAETPDQDFLDLVPDPAERVNIINRALVLKQQQYVRREMLNDEFTPVEGVYDLKQVCAQKSERQKVDPMEKAAAALTKATGKNVTPEILAQLIAQLSATPAAPAPTPGA